MLRMTLAPLKWLPHLYIQLQRPSNFASSWWFYSTFYSSVTRPSFGDNGDDYWRMFWPWVSEGRLGTQASPEPGSIWGCKYTWYIQHWPHPPPHISVCQLLFHSSRCTKCGLTALACYKTNIQIRKVHCTGLGDYFPNSFDNLLQNFLQIIVILCDKH